MPESPESSNDIAEIRRELRRLNEKVDGVGADVKDVGARVENVEKGIGEGNAARLATMSLAMSSEGDADDVLRMANSGMSTKAIASALNMNSNAVRVRLHRARRRAAGKAAKADG